jgi:hypothetical protein
MLLLISQYLPLLDYCHSHMSVVTQSTVIIDIINSKRKNKELSALKNIKVFDLTRLSIADKAS